MADTPANADRAPQTPAPPDQPLLDIDCIIPAAGFSSRTDTHKLTTEFAGRPLVAYAVAHALAACTRVIVVLGHNARAVRNRIAGSVLWPPAGDQPPGAGRAPAARLLIVHNPDYRHGMITSIARGAAEVRTARFFVAPADMPFLTPALYRRVADAAAEADSGKAPPGGGDPGPPAAWLPEYRGRPAHPTLISTAVRNDLTSLVRRPAARSPETAAPLPSMRAFLAGYRTVAVPVDEQGAVIDIDTAEDITRYAADPRVTMEPAGPTDAEP